MNRNSLQVFFGWCLLLNGALLVFSSLVIRFAHAQVFWMHSDWVALNNETFNLAVYLLLGIWKLLVIVFNLVPYVALVVMNRQQRNSSAP